MAQGLAASCDTLAMISALLGNWVPTLPNSLHQIWTSQNMKGWTDSPSWIEYPQYRSALKMTITRPGAIGRGPITGKHIYPFIPRPNHLSAKICLARSLNLSHCRSVISQGLSWNIKLDLLLESLHIQAQSIILMQSNRLTAGIYLSFLECINVHYKYTTEPRRFNVYFEMGCYGLCE